MSRTFWSRPCSAAWSVTGPSMIVVPSLSVMRFNPSNQAAQRRSRCPLRRIWYRPRGWWFPVVSFIGVPRVVARPGWISAGVRWLVGVIES